VVNEPRPVYINDILFCLRYRFINHHDQTGLIFSGGVTSLFNICARVPEHSLYV